MNVYIDGYYWSVGSYFNSVGGNCQIGAPNAQFVENISGLTEVPNKKGRFLCSTDEAQDDQFIAIELKKPVKKGIFIKIITYFR